LYGPDRGFFSEKNVTSCKQQGVKVVCIPQRGGTKSPEREAYEKTREFKDGQRFRAGIEGRISVLFRGRGMKRCLAEGRERFVGRGGRARQQPHEDRGAVGGPIGAQTKSRLILSIKSFIRSGSDRRPHCDHCMVSTGASRNRIENRVKIRGECRDPPSVCPGFIG
jgi:hypothetical protein